MRVINKCKHYPNEFYRRIASWALKRLNVKAKKFGLIINESGKPSYSIEKVRKGVQFDKGLDLWRVFIGRKDGNSYPLTVTAQSGTVVFQSHNELTIFATCLAVYYQRGYDKPLAWQHAYSALNHFRADAAKLLQEWKSPTNRKKKAKLSKEEQTLIDVRDKRDQWMRKFSLAMTKFKMYDKRVARAEKLLEAKRKAEHEAAMKVKKTTRRIEI